MVATLDWMVSIMRVLIISFFDKFNSFRGGIIIVVSHANSFWKMNIICGFVWTINSNDSDKVAYRLVVYILDIYNKFPFVLILFLL